jgi:hypothetical protein
VSGKVTGWFLRLADKPEDRDLFKVLVVMADASNDQGANIRLATETVGFRAKCTRWMARKLLEEAAADGAHAWALELVRPGDHRRAAEYRFPHYRPFTNHFDAERLLAELSSNPANIEKLMAVFRQYVGGGEHSNRHQMAELSTQTATNVSTETCIAPPRPPREGEGGPAQQQTQTVASPAKQEKATVASPARQEKARATRAELAASCPYCDEYGWSERPDGTGDGDWCKHPKQAKGRR